MRNKSSSERLLSLFKQENEAMNNAVTELFQTNKIGTACVEIVVTINMVPV